MINRNIIEALTDSVKHFPITLLTGPRQIGKSTILYSSFLDKGFSYVSLDDRLELITAKNDPRSFLSLHPYPLIIDEIQNAPELFPEIERIVNQVRLEKGNKDSNGLFILSGSNRKRLMDESTESLSGRVGILDMYNLSLNEILGMDNVPFSIDLNQLSKRFNRFHINETEVFEYIIRGFFPVLYEDWELNFKQFYSSYVSTYLEKDLKDILNVNDELNFMNFLRLLASNTGEELVYDNYAKQVGISVNTVKSWISVLSKTGIIYLVSPYNEESMVKRIVKRPKLYFFDTGLAAFLCGIDSAKTLQGSFLKGRFFETFIFNEIKKSYLNAGVNQEIYYYRDTNQNEIDMILLKEGVLSCIEIKTGQSFNASNTKGFKQLANTKFQKGKNAIICTTEKISVLNDGILQIPVSSI